MLVLSEANTDRKKEPMTLPCSESFLRAVSVPKCFVISFKILTPFPPYPLFLFAADTSGLAGLAEASRVE